MLKSYSFLISSIHSSTRLHCIKPCSTGLRRFGIKCGNQSRLRFRFTANSSFRLKSNSPFLSCQSLKKNEMLIKLYYSTKVENTGLSNRNSQLIKISKLIKPEAKSIAGAIFLLVVSSSVTLSVPFLMGKVIDVVQEASDKGVLQGTLIPAAAFLSFIFIMGAVANTGRVYLLQMSGQRITKSLRESLFSSIVAQDIAFFDKTRTGELINRLASDVEVVSGAVTQNVSDGLRAFAQITAGVGMMFYMCSELATSILAVVPPVALAAVVYGRYLRRLTSQTQDKLAESSQLTEETFSGIRTVRSFAKEMNEQRSYVKKMDAVLSLAKKESIARSLFFGLTGLSGNAIMLFVLYNGGLLMHAGQITVGDLSAFLLYSGYVAISIAGLSNFYTAINKSIGASERIFELIERTPKIPLEVGLIPDESVEYGDIRFEAVDFSYSQREEQPVFKNLNLTIPAGKVTAIVGPSGCGKTTIGSLLLRFYEPNGGVITIGDMNLNDINPVWIRNHVGSVSQEPTLFSTSIRENIAYGAPSGRIASEIEVENAAKKANAYEFISALPQGFDTEVGERGITLSGGQRQRVAIARALIKNPKILLLDEATSALDAASEYLVRDALEKLYVGRTTIIIAHRLSTVQGAHSIVVLGDDGTVKERGSYKKLMNNENGYFRKLVEQQTLIE